MKSYRQFYSCLALMTASLGLSAADLDVTAPVLCAVTQTVSCDRQGVCTEGPADAVNLPVFFKIDLKNKVVTSAKQAGEQRTSKLLNVNADGAAVVLVGFEPEGSWSAIIDKATGSMTLSVAESSLGYLVFGACLKH